MDNLRNIDKDISSFSDANLVNVLLHSNQKYDYKINQIILILSNHFDAHHKKFIKIQWTFFQFVLVYCSIFRYLKVFMLHHI